MRTRILIKAGVTALGSLLFLGGCTVAPPPTPVERDYGLSHRLALYRQIACPDAGKKLEPVECRGRDNPSGAEVTIPIQKKNQADGQGKTEK